MLAGVSPRPPQQRRSIRVARGRRGWARRGLGAALLAGALIATVHGRGQACEEVTTPSLLTRAREPGAQLVHGTVASLAMLSVDWPVTAAGPRPLRVLGPVACRGPWPAAGTEVLAVVHGGTELRRGMASLRRLDGLTTTTRAQLGSRLLRWQSSQQAAAEARALLELLPLHPVLATEAGARLQELAVQRALPEAVVAEIGVRARRPGVGRAELAVLLELGRSLKPDWYDDTIIALLAHGSPDVLALAGEHTLACWEERVVITVAGRLRDPDPRARAAAAEILHDRSGQTFGCQHTSNGWHCQPDATAALAWERWLRANLAHRKLP
jgi:hypothetical protein